MGLAHKLTSVVLNVQKSPIDSAANLRGHAKEGGK